MRRLLLLAAVLIAACGTTKSQSGPDASLAPTPAAGLSPGPNAIPWRVANGITACGVVRAYSAATATAPGSLRIGSRTFAIAPGTAAAGSSGFPPAVDKPMCIWGGLDGSPATAPNADPLEVYRCGRVRDFAAPTAGATGRLKTLDYWSDGEAEFIVPIGAQLGTLRYDDYRCFTLSVDAAGDAVAVTRDVRQADADLACGRVRGYAPATASTPGVIGIGSKTFGIPAGVTYLMDPAGARNDPIAIGQITCLRAMLDDAGAIARYGPVNVMSQPGANGLIGGGICGRIVAFKAPTATVDGFVAFALNGSLVRIPSATKLTPLADRYQRCYDLALDAQGDMIAVMDKDQPPVGF
jgi:hypothetical protein